MYVSVVAFADHKQSFCFYVSNIFHEEQINIFCACTCCVPVWTRFRSKCVCDTNRKGTTKSCSIFMWKKGEMNVVCCESVCEKRIRGMDCILNTYITQM